MLKPDSVEQAQASKLSPPHGSRSFLYNADTQTFEVDGSSVPLRFLERHTRLAAVPTTLHRPSLVKITNALELYVSRDIHAWAQNHPADVLRTSEVMQHAYNAMFASRKPRGACGFNANYMPQREVLSLGVPGFVALDIDRQNSNEDWARYRFNREPDNLAQRNALLAGLGHIAQQAQHEPVLAGAHSLDSVE